MEQIYIDKLTRLKYKTAPHQTKQASGIYLVRLGNPDEDNSFHVSYDSLRKDFEEFEQPENEGWN